MHCCSEKAEGHSVKDTLPSLSTCAWAMGERGATHFWCISPVAQSRSWFQYEKESDTFSPVTGVGVGVGATMGWDLRRGCDHVTHPSCSQSHRNPAHHNANHFASNLKGPSTLKGGFLSSITMALVAGHLEC